MLVVGAEMCKDLLIYSDERPYVQRLSGCGCLRPPGTPRKDDKKPVFALSREEEGGEEEEKKQNLTKE